MIHLSLRARIDTRDAPPATANSSASTALAPPPTITTDLFFGDFPVSSLEWYTSPVKLSLPSKRGFLASPHVPTAATTPSNRPCSPPLTTHRPSPSAARATRSTRHPNTVRSGSR
jgi:hypothetical protein